MKQKPESRIIARTLALLCASIGLAACEPLAITSFGVGASSAVSHTLGGITYRTFTAPVARVKMASLSALNRMGIRHIGTEKVKEGEVLKAVATDRQIEITLEPLSPTATRVRVVARNGGIFFDSSTAIEIILQTERLLGNA